MASYDMRFVIQDGKSPAQRSTMVIHFSDTETIASLTTKFGQLVSLINAMIDGVIIGGSLTLPLPLPGSPGTALATADVEEGSLWILQTLAGFKSKFRIPTFKESLIDAGGEVDQTNAAVIAFLGNLLNAPIASDNRGDALDSVVLAREMFQKSRKR